jgi:hypothetical protein
VPGGATAITGVTAQFHCRIATDEAARGEREVSQCADDGGRGHAGVMPHTEDALGESAGVGGIPTGCDLTPPLVPENHQAMIG